MAGGYVYNADIWASVVGEEFRKMTNSRLVGGILADRCCSLNFNLSHFPRLASNPGAEEGVRLGSRLFPR